MNKKELLIILKDMGICGGTASFYVSEEPDENGEYGESESFFGTCDISGIKGDIVHCIALDENDNIIHFNAGTWLVHGYLGELAGAF
jgi:hypothetical protein